MRVMPVVLRALTASTLALAPSSIAADTKNITARVVTADQRKDCKYLGIVTYRKALGWDKAGGALKHALLKSQEMGGDSLYIVTEHQDPIAGASITGEALKCGA
jgi:hypothetical protein